MICLLKRGKIQVEDILFQLSLYLNQGKQGLNKYPQQYMFGSQNRHNCGANQNLFLSRLFQGNSVTDPTNDPDLKPINNPVDVPISISLKAPLKISQTIPKINPYY